MNKIELKKVLKPLIKQCIKEVLLEEGVLSNIVSEVAIGFKPLLVENKTTTLPQNYLGSEASLAQENVLLQQKREELEEEKRRAIKEQKIKILNATGFGNEIFEGIDPIPSGGSPDNPAVPGALTGVDPGDAGVDIAGIMALGGHKWNKLV